MTDPAQVNAALLAALKGLRTVVMPWIDAAIRRPGTVSFAEWDAACEQIERAIATAEASPSPDRAQKELALIREAAQDDSLSDGAVRAIAAGLSEPTAEDIEWGKAALHVPPAAEASPSSAWREIASAPKDGTPVLLFVPDAPDGYLQVQIDRWTGPKRRSVGHFDGWWEEVVGVPTHWQPLPNPPAAEASPRETEEGK